MPYPADRRVSTLDRGPRRADNKANGKRGWQGAVTEVGPTTQPPIGARAEVPLPLGLWVVAALLVVGGVGFLMVVFDVGPPFLAGGLVGIKDSQVGQPVLVVTGVAMLLAAVGLLLRVPSAWGLTMLIVGLGLVVNLIAYFTGDPNFLRMAIFVLMAFYLNGRPVREVFLGVDAGRRAR